MTPGAALVTALLLLQCGVLAIKSPFDPPPVIIRLDDVTGGWCEEQSKASIQAVLDLNTPINVGLIGIELDESALLTEYLASIADNRLVEMVSHSFHHKSFAGKPLEWQEEDLADLNSMSNKLTGKLPMTFIPPKNEFDDNTIIAMQNNPDMHILSAQCNWIPGTSEKQHCVHTSLMNLSVVSPNIKVSGLYVLPTGAVLGDVDYWNNYLLPGSVENGTAWLESQIANQGFGVLMLHPVEFATDSTCAVIDWSKINVLTDLIKSNTETIPTGKWKFMLYHDAVEYLTGDVVQQSEREYGARPDHKTPVYPFLLVIGGISLFMLGSCACSYYTPELKKVQKKVCCGAV